MEFVQDSLSHWGSAVAEHSGANSTGVFCVWEEKLIGMQANSLDFYRSSGFVIQIHTNIMTVDKEKWGNVVCAYWAIYFLLYSLLCHSMSALMKYFLSDGHTECFWIKVTTLLLFWSSFIVISDHWTKWTADCVLSSCWPSADLQPTLRCFYSQNMAFSLCMIVSIPVMLQSWSFLW